MSVSLRVKIVLTLSFEFFVAIQKVIFGLLNSAEISRGYKINLVLRVWRISSVNDTRLSVTFISLVSTVSRNRIRENTLGV